MGGAGYVSARELLLKTMNRLKRAIIWGLIVLVFGFVSYAIGAMQQRLTEKETSTQKRQHRPELSRIQLINQPTSAKSLPVGVRTGFTNAMLDNQTVVVVFFDPDCEHCQYEAGQFSKRAAEFGSAQVFWLTTATLVRARLFARQFGLDTLNRFHVGAVSRDEAYRAFGPTSNPHLFIYGPDGSLRKEYRGEVKLEAVLNYL